MTCKKREKVKQLYNAINLWELLAKGIVTVQCNDTAVFIRPFAGERCLRACRRQPVQTPDGAILYPPNIDHGNQATHIPYTIGKGTPRANADALFLYYFATHLQTI